MATLHKNSSPRVIQTSLATPNRASIVAKIGRVKIRKKSQKPESVSNTRNLLATKWSNKTNFFLQSTIWSLPNSFESSPFLLRFRHSFSFIHLPSSLHPLLCFSEAAAYFQKSWERRERPYSWLFLNGLPTNFAIIQQHSRNENWYRELHTSEANHTVQ